jgi:DNA-binding winged helix-turn-helix (wHTH) protein/tetratricopeptide (TPR) repeat protein
MGKMGKELYEFGPFRIDPDKRILLRENQPVPLQLKAFETLLVLVRNSEQVVLKDDLMKSVWPDTFVEESNLAQNIFVLRKTLGETVGDHRYIVTIPGRGYRFAGKVRVISEEESLVVESHARSRIVIEESKPRRNLAISAAGLLLLLALGLIAGSRYRRPQQRGQSASPSQATAVTPRRSVAVLGFQNLSGRSDPAWLSTAFSEMLTTELGAGDQLRMVSSEEVAHLKTSLSPLDGGTLSRDTLARIHQLLGADVVVLGSYSALGKQSRGQIRLDVRLQDTAAGETMATISETGTEADLFQLVSRAGARLREKVAVPAISGGQEAGVQASVPSNLEAARLYAEGLEKLRQFDALAARSLLDQAIHADPAFALTHSALAEAWSQLGYEGKAQMEARKSFELSDKLPRKDHLFIEARYRSMNKDWDKALELYHTLFNFFPDDIEYGLRLADAQTQAGKRNDALATIQLLRQLPPPAKDDARIDLAEELNYIRLGQYSTARPLATRTVEKTRANGSDLLLARALYLQAATLAPLGEGDKAITSAEEAWKIYQHVGDQAGVSNALEYIAYVHTGRAEWEAAEKIYQQALAVNRAIGSKTGAAVDLTSIAAVRESRGDIEGGKKMAEQALAIYREIGDRSREGWALMGVAWATSAEGELAASLVMDDQALAIFTEVADDGGAAYALDEKTSQLTMLGDLSQAQQSAQRSLALAQKNGNQVGIISDLHYLGNIAKLEGKLEDARKEFSEALTRAQHDSMAQRVVGEDLALAEIAEEGGQLQEAKKQIDAALSTLHTYDDPSEEAGAQVLLARMDLAQGNVAEASHAIDSARAFLSKVPEDREAHFVFGITQARVQAAMGKFAEARQSLATVIAETSKQDNVRYLLEARLALCEVEAKKDPASARAQAKTLAQEATSRGFGLIARKALAVGA